MCEKCDAARAYLDEHLKSLKGKSGSIGAVGDLVADEGVVIAKKCTGDSKAASELITAMMVWSSRVHEASIYDTIHYVFHNMPGVHNSPPEPSMN